MRAATPLASIALGAAAALAVRVAFAAPSPSPADTAAASPVRVEATASKTDVTIGETFEVTLTVAGPEGATYSFPAEQLSDAIELRSLARAASPGAWPPNVHRYAALILALDPAEVPPLEVRYRLADGREGHAKSEPLHLTIVSLLPKEAEGRKPAELRPPVPVSIGAPFWVAVTGVLVLGGSLAVAALLWLRWHRGGPTPTPKAPTAAPDVLAFAAIDRLVASGLLERGELRAFYIELVAIAKRYLEDRMSLPIVEMTSVETLAALRSDERASAFHALVRDLTTAADEVKFAKAGGLRPEAERHAEAVRGLVRGLEVRLTPPPPAAPEGR